MTCAKAYVPARIVLPDGTEFTGANDCNRPQAACPRVGAAYARDDYSMCGSVCWQWGHAEAVCLAKAARARADLSGAWAYVGWHRICGDCRAALNARGIPDERIVCEVVA
ncbi:hypothetical protein UFOVP78_19 [uncultured Caudovirales phage]|uniref:Cytidine and deoxycytidylate deaminase domain containing protein n=1 Tax=uncultured Caudovirales phage TaxID=2100421 RepID=A0A6J5KWA3_9CAUD|nr:hypothetical protein UFOVP78_19 [uncultured Caudovirales phage]